MRGKRGLAVLLGLVMMLFLAACKGGSESSGTPEGNVALQGRINEDLIYFAENLDFELGSGVANVDFKVYGMNIYYPVENRIVTYSCTDEKSTADIYQWADAPGEWHFERVCYSGTGDVYGVVNVSAGGDSTYYLCKFDAERKLTFARDLTEYYQDAGESFSESSRLEVGDDGRVILSGNSVLWIFDEEGSFKGTVSFGDIEDVWVRDFQSNPERKLYVLYEDNVTGEQYVAEIDTEKSTVKAVQQTIGLTGISVLEDKLLGFNGATVYTYDREELALTELFHWTECGAGSTLKYSAKQLLDGRIFVAGTPSWGGVESLMIESILPDAGISSDSDKTIIRVALYGSPYVELEAFTYQFNKNNGQYEVILDNYKDNGGEEALARLKAELAAGKGPDLISMEFGMVRSLVEDGYLEDLSMYLAESGEISEGDFLDFATEAYKIEGTLAAIPHRFSMHLTVGNSEILGEESGWTMEEYLDFLEENAGSSVHAMFDTNAKLVCREILRLNSEYFMDMDACTCNFDNDIFRKLVEVLRNYPLDYDYTQGIETWKEKFQSGKAVIETVSVHDFMTLQMYEAVLGDNLNCIGLPAEAGVGVWAWMEDALGISIFSEHKEGAWEFLEDFLQYRLGNPRATDFTAYLPSLEVYADWFMNQVDLGQWRVSSQDPFQPYRIPDQEEIDRYMELIEMAQPGFNEYEMINDIIIPEMGYYYDGKKTMDEMIASIEGRVEVYLKEHR